MYLPRHFDQQDAAAITGLITENPLATLVTRKGDALEANHIPFLLEGEFAIGTRLLGHVAQANNLWQQASDSAESLLIFQGPSAYITPNWYPSKQEHHQVVPTYNYAVVHLYGYLVASEDEGVKHKVVEQLTAMMEQGRASQWKITDAPADYIARMLGAIVAIAFHVTRVEAKWKVSQNRSASDRNGVAAGLAREGKSEADRLMSRMVNPGAV